MKTRKPKRIVLRPEVFGNPEITSGELIYYYSDRKLIKQGDKRFKRAATRNGFHHLKDQDQNGLMVFIRRPKAVIRIQMNGKTYEGNIGELVKEYNDDADTLSPEAFMKYACAINKKGILSPRIMEQEIYIM